MPQCPGALPDANQGTLMLATSFGFLLFRLLFLRVVACAGAGASSPVHSHPSASMLPTLPDRARHDRSHVVGLPGDRVQMIKGRLSRNGEARAAGRASCRGPPPRHPCGPIASTCLAVPAIASCGQMAATAPPRTRPFVPGNPLVPGDNRDNAIDSRHHTPNDGVGFLPIVGG